MAKTQKLNVGLVFDDSLDRTDGVAQNVKTLGAWLSRRGHKVSYLVGETRLESWEGAPVYSLSKNLKVRFNGNQLSMPLPGNVGKIKDLLADHSFDVIHVTLPYSPFMAAKVIHSARAETAIIGTFHIFPSGLLSAFGSRVLKIILFKTLRRFDAQLSVSQPAAQFAREVFHIRSNVVPNPVDLARFRQKKPVMQSDEQTIVFLGRLVKRKGPTELINAFARLARENTKVKLIIAGDGPQRRQLEALVRKYHLSSRVNFLGFVSEEHKIELLGSATIACFPSLYGESFGIVLIEAMAAGSRTILAGDNPGYKSVLGSRPNQLINPKNTAVFADRLNYFLNHPKQAAAAYQWQTQQANKYDINVVGAEVEKIYYQTIAHLRKNSHNETHG